MIGGHVAEQIAAKAIVAVDPAEMVDRRIPAAGMKSEGGRVEKVGASAKAMRPGPSVS